MVVELLLDYRADATATNEDERKALLRAIHSKYEGVVRLLLDCRVDAKARGPGSGGVIRVFLASIKGRELVRGISTSSKDAIGDIVLMEAVDRRHEAIVRLLLDYRADSDTRDEIGSTVLIQAAECGCKAVAELLLERRSDTNARDSSGWTALILAAKGGYTAVVQYLLSHRADTSTRDKDGRTPL
jgi:uncharacterized protein